MDDTHHQQDKQDFAALVGIDWADQEHSICLLETRCHKMEHYNLKQTPEAIELWAAELRTRFSGQPIAIAVEQSKGALIYGLMKYDFLVLFPVNPKQLARYREVMAPSGAKNDPDDAELLCDLLLKHPEKLRPWKPDDEQTRLIGMLGQDRRNAVNMRSKLSSSLRAKLKQYFPQALQLVARDPATTMACNLLLKWPTLQQLQRARPQSVRHFYLQHNCRDIAAIQRRLELIASAQPLTSDSAVVESAVMQVRLLARQLLELNEAIDAYDRRLGELMAQHPDGDIFSSFPGAGDAFAPRLLAAFGSDRDRIQSARQIQDYSGIAPVTKKSGKSKIVHRRFACPKFLRQTFHEFAAQSLKFSPWARAYYDLQKAEGSEHHAAVRALAFKWIRVIYACWKRRTKYDEARYLRALRARNSPLLEYLVS